MKRMLWFICILLLTPLANAAPTLIIESGMVTGIAGIHVVSGSFNEIYDVTFRDGTCINIFTGCNSNAEDLHPINTRLSAANAALLPLLGSFSDSPQLIRGCESLADCLITGVSNINTAGPSGGNVSGGTLWVQAGVGNDLPINESSAASRSDDLTLVNNRVYAVWEPAALAPPIKEGVNSDGSLTSATFAKGVSSDNGNSFSETFTVGETITIPVSFNPEADEVGIDSEIFVVVSADNPPNDPVFLQATPTGLMGFDAALGIAGLVPFSQVVLEQTTVIDLLAPFGGPYTLTNSEIGNWRIFVGYSTGDGVITYCEVGIVLEVTQ